MSTKIYYGFRFRVSRLKDQGFITSLRSAAMMRFIDDLARGWWKVRDNLIKDKPNEKDEENKHYIDLIIESKNEPDDGRGMFYVLELWLNKPNIIELYKSTLVLFFHGEWVIGYISAYDGVAMTTKEHLLKIDGVEDYSYWNNTDQPDDIDDLEWKRRRKAWDSVVDTDRLFVDGVSADNVVNVSTTAQKELKIGFYREEKVVETSEVSLD